MQNNLKKILLAATLF